MAGDEGTPERQDPASAAARSMTQLAQQMREMAERMLGGGMAAWPVAGAAAGKAGPAQADTVQADTAQADTAQAGPARTGSAAGTGGAGGSGPAAGRPAAAVPGLPAIPGMPPMPGLPATPATMSARQLQAVVDDIAARRQQVQALVAQLQVFDEQLGTLETSLAPILQWLRTWSDLEGAVTDFWTAKPPR
jgi:hypothetical protein